MTSEIDAGTSLGFRAATPSDAERLIAILNDPPPPETLAIVGSVSKALVAGRMLLDAGLSLVPDRTTVAVEGGVVVALIEAGAGDREDPGPLAIARLALPVVARLGPKAFVRALRWQAINARVQFDPESGAYHIAELDVAASHRGRGIGGMLLEQAETAAGREGRTRMTLSTKLTNPARRLYERHGFRVAATKLDAEWERWAASPGRVWMAKNL